MPAKNKYLSSLFLSFSTFLENSLLTKEQAEQTLTVFDQLLKYLKKDSDRIDPSQIDSFFANQPNCPNISKQIIFNFFSQIPTHQTSVFLNEFLLALKSNGCLPSTIKNYRSDISQFLNFASENEIISAITKPKVQNFISYQIDSDIKTSSIERKLKSINQFCIWLISKNILNKNPIHSTNPDQWIITPVTTGAKFFLDEFLRHLKSENHTQATVRNYKSDITQFIDFAKTNDISKIISRGLVITFVNSQKNKQLKDNSIKRKLKSLNQFAGWLSREKIIAKNPITDYETLLTNASDKPFDHAAGKPKSNNFNFVASLINRSFGSSRSSSSFVPSTSADKQDNNTRTPKDQTPNTNQQPAKKSARDEKSIPISPTVSSAFNQTFSGISNLRNQVGTLSRKVGFQTSHLVITYLNLLLLLVFILGFGFFGYQQFFANVEQKLAYPTSLVRPNRVLSFQGRLTDTAQNPITISTDFVFRLYDSGPSIVGGNILWESGTCGITPDQDGIFSTGLGDECGDEIDENVFTMNNNVWLQVEVESEILDPRQQIKTVPYALNSETLQGFPASQSAVENTVLIMDNNGDVNLGSFSPTLRSTSGTFTIEGQNIVIQTTSGSNGDIVLAPDGLGEIIAQSYIYAPGATLSATYADGIPLTLKGGPSGTANLTEWKDNSNSLVALIGADGSALFSNFVNTSEYQVNNYSALSSSGTNLRMGENAYWQSLDFYTNGSSRITVDSSGNVGIGTTSPGVKLDVSGQTKITSDTFPPLQVVRETTITNDLASGVLLETKTSGDMTDGFGGGFIFGLSDNTFSGTGANGQARIYAKRDGGDGLASLGFYTSNLVADPDPKMIIRATGNVGIGTTNPISMFSVGSGSLFQVNSSGIISSIDGVAHTVDDVSGNLTLTSNSSTISLNDSVTFASTTTINGLTYTWPASQTANYVLQTNGSGTLSWVDPAAAIASNIYWTLTNQQIHPKNALVHDLMIGGTSTASAKFFAQANTGNGYFAGNVGIGTSTPSQKLDVNGYINTANGLTIGGGTATSQGIAFPNNYKLRDVGTDIRFDDNLGNTLIAMQRVSSGGYVGIGTVSPTAKLDIAGSASLSGTLAFRGTTDPKIDVLNGENFGIRTSLNGDAGLTERMTILNNGNVGIGTTNPTTKLQVIGDAYIQNGTISVGYGTVSTNYTIRLPNNNAIGWRNAGNTGDIPGIKVDASNNVILGANILAVDTTNSRVGINTTTPSEALDVVGNLKLSGTTTLNNQTYTWPASQTANYVLQTNGSGTLSWADPAAAVASSIYWTLTGQQIHPKNALVHDLMIGGTSTTSAKFFAQANTGNGYFAGNVGIGTTSPSAGLQITRSYIDSLNTNLRLTGNIPGISFEDTVATSVHRNFAILNDYANAGKLAFTYSSSQGGNPTNVAMEINGATGDVTMNSNVGIGTASPTAKLDIAGSASLSGTLAFRGTTDPKIDVLNGENFGFRTSLNGDAGLTEKITITNAGYLGIGTTSPNQKLQITSGNIQMDNAYGIYFSDTNWGLGRNLVSDAGGMLTNNTLQIKVWDDVQQGLQVVNNNADILMEIRGNDGQTIFNGGGNVGIGTTAPDNTLDIVGTLDVSGTTEFNNIAYTWPASQTANYVLQTNGSGTLSWVDPASAVASTIYWTLTNEQIHAKNALWHDLMIGGTSTASAKFFAQASTGNGYFAGNVGIGTSTPSQKLDVNGYINTANGLTIGGGTAISQGIAFPNNYKLRDVGTDIRFDDSPGNTLLAIQKVSSGGNVGIGTASPTAKLDIAGSASLSGTLAFRGTTDPKIDVLNGENFGFRTSLNGDAGLTEKITITNAGYLGIGTTSPSAKLHINNGNFYLTGPYVIANTDNPLYLQTNSSQPLIFRTNYNEQMRLSSSGNLGIGTASPSEKLDVVGNIKVSGTTNFGDIAYTWPSAQTANYVLQTNGSGTLSWVDPATAVASTIYWTSSNGALYPKNSTMDLLVGGQATASAKFWVNATTGDASASGNLTIGTGNQLRSVSGPLNLAYKSNASNSYLTGLTLTDQGKVGIGTATPTYQLEVKTEAFDSVLTYVSPTYTDRTPEAKTSYGTVYTLAAAANTSFYVGNSRPFDNIYFDLNSVSTAGRTLTFEYSQGGSSWNTISVTDGTNALTVDGTMSFIPPTNWATDTVSTGSNLYWIRVTSTNDPGTDPTAYVTVPTNTNAFAVYAQSGDSTPAIHVGRNGDIYYRGSASNSAGAPSFTWMADTDTGMFRVTTDTLGFATVGIERFRINSSGNSIVSGNMDVLGDLSAADFSTGALAVGTVTSRDAIFVASGGASAYVNPGGTVAFYDTFLGTDNSLDTHSPDIGTSWDAPLIQTGGVTLRAQTTGKADSPTTTANVGALYTTSSTLPSADYEVSVTADVVTTSDDNAIIAARVQGVDNDMYLFKFSSTAANNILYKRFGGTWTSLGVSSYGVVAGNTIKLRVVGSNISVWRDNVLMISAVDSDITGAGKAGLGVGAIVNASDDTSTVWDLDDFTVRLYDSPIQTALFTDDCTDAGSCSTSNSMVQMTQTNQYSTGPILALDSQGSTNNGLSIDIASSSINQYALNLTSNNGGTLGLSVRGNGYVGIGTTVPSEKLDVVGNLKISGTTTLNNLTYTWPSAQTASYVLSTNGSGTLSWVDPNTVGASTNYWTLTGEQVHPKNALWHDLAIGGTSTSSASIFGAANTGYLNAQRFSDTANSDYYLDPAATGTSMAVAGSVGIGTTSPSQLLHLSAVNGGGARIKLEADLDNSDEADNAEILFSQDGGAVTGSIGFDAGSNNSLDIKNIFNGNIRLFTNNAEVAVFESTGNIGFGVTNAINLLDVDGSVAIGDSYAGIATAPTNGLLVQGNVGIGTTAPDNTLDLVGTLDVSGTTEFNNIAYTWPASQTANYVLQTNGSGTLSWIDAGSLYAGSNIWTKTNEQIHPQNALWNDLIIGGTSTASAKFYTQANTGNTLIGGTLSLTGTAAGTDNSVLVLNSSNQVVTDEIDSRVWGTTLVDGAGTANYVARWTPDTNTLGTGVLYDDGTNVGIGTTVPGAKLDISGQTRSNTFLGGNNGSPTAVVYGVGNETDTGMYGLTTNTLNFATDGQERVRISSTGNVGIGSTNPDNTLDLVGTLDVSGTTEFNNIAYTWPASQTNGYILQTNGSGTLSWADPAVVAGASNQWALTGEQIHPKNALWHDLAIGGTSTSSAKFFVAANTGDTTVGGTLSLTGTGAGTDNSVLVLNGSNQVVTDEIDPRVWGATLIDGSGTANYVARFSDADTLTTGVLYDNGTNVGVGTTVPTALLDIAGMASSSAGLTFRGTTDPTINALNGESLTFRTSLNGDAGLKQKLIIADDTTTIYGNRSTGDNARMMTLGSGGVHINPDNYGSADTYSLFRVDGGASDYLFFIYGNNRDSVNIGAANTDMDHLLGVFSKSAGDIALKVRGTTSQTGNLLELQNVGGTGLSAFDAAGYLGIGTTDPNDALDVVGNIDVSGTTEFNNIAYTWPASQTVNYVLQTNGSGTLSWADPAAAAASSIHWALANGSIYPKNSTVDLLVGSNATTSAKFWVNSTTGDASASGNLTVGNGGQIRSAYGPLNLAYKSGANAWTTGMVITEQGNVGVGTTNPSGKLHVYDSTGTSNFYVKGDAAGYPRVYLGGSSGTVAGVFNRITTAAGIYFGEDGDTGTTFFRGTGGLKVSGTNASNSITATIQNNASNATTNFARLSLAPHSGFAATNSPYIQGYNNGNDAGLSFGTYSSSLQERMRITDTGLVGIGTTTIDNTLEVNGTIDVSGTTEFNNIAYTWPASQTANYVLQTNGSGTLSWADPAAAAAGSILWTLDSGTAQLKNTTLDMLVGGTSTASAKFAVLNMNSGTPVASISANSGNIATYITGNGTLATTNRNNLTIGNSSTYNTTGNVLINPNGTGNVGIGTTNPLAKLEVNGNILTNGSIYFGADDTATYPSITQSTNNLILKSGSADSTYLWLQSQGHLYFDFDSDNTGADEFKLRDSDNVEIMTVDSDGNGYFAGNVGIGTTAPATSLQISGANTTGYGQLSINNNAGGYARISLYDNGTKTGVLQSSSASFILGSDGVSAPISFWTNSNEKMRLSAAGGLSLGSSYVATDPGAGNAIISGNVGIGTTAPDNTLDLVGTLDVSGTTEFNNIAYTWPSSQTASYVLQTNGSGTLSWVDPSTVGASTNYWTLTNEQIHPKNTLWHDLAIGGTSTASAKFFVAANTGNTTVGGTLSLTGTSAGTDNSVLVLNGSNQVVTDEIDNRVWGSTLVDGSGTANYVARFSDADTLTTGVLYDNGTNVGIGTTVPDNTLDLVGTLDVSGTTEFNNIAYTWPATQGSSYVLQTNGSGALSWVDPTSLGLGGGSYWATTGQQLHPVNYANLDLMIGGTSTASAKFYAQANTGNGYFAGNVGIGTTAPNVDLEINGNARIESGLLQIGGTGYSLAQITQGIFLGETVGKSAALEFLGSDANLGYGWKVESRDIGGSLVPLVFSFRQNSTTWSDFMSINNAGSGQLGLGTTSPTATLDVRGTAVFNEDQADNDFRIEGDNETNLFFTDASTDRIGIGTNNPAEHVTIYSNYNGMDAMSIRNVNTNSNAFAEFSVANGANIADGLRLLTMSTGWGTSGGFIQDAGIINADSNLSGGLSLMARNASANMRFYTGGSDDANERMRISSTGLVGIGTTAPDNTLDVVGTLDISGTTEFNNIAYTWPASQTANYVLQTNGSGTLSWVDPAAAVSATNYWTLTGQQIHPKNALVHDLMIGGTSTASAKFFAQANTGNGYFAGNVGIGTTTPDYALQVNGVVAPETTDQDLGTTALRWDLLANTINADSTVTLTGLGTGTDDTVLILNSSNQVTTDEIDPRVWGSTLVDGSGTANYVARWTPDTNTLGTGVLYDDGTNVGVGTTVPTAKLDVAGSASLSGTLAFRGTTDPKIDVLNGENFGIRTSLNGDAGLTERMTILNNGNVGIGTTNPTVNLDVRGSNSATALFQSSSNAGTRININNTGTNGRNYGIGSNFITATGEFGIYDYTANTSRLIISAAGNVGIGTTNPGNLLQLGTPGTTAGTLSLAGATSGLVTVDVAATAGTWAFTLPTSGGTNGYLLQTDGSGNTSWLDPSTLILPSFWQLNDQQISPANALWHDLAIGGTSTASAQFFVQANTGYTRAQRFQDTANTDYYLDPAAVGTSLAVAGKVGIGTTNPTHKLTIAGATSTISNVSGDITIDSASNNVSLSGNNLINFAQLQGNNGSVSVPTFAFQNDTDTGIYMASTANMRFVTAGTDRITIDSSGSVGIGTTAPTALLHLEKTLSSGNLLKVGNNGSDKFTVGWDGHATISGSLTIGTSSLKLADNGTYSTINSTGNLSLQSASGNVGIGTTSPTSKLDIAGSASLSGTLAFRGTTDPKIDILNGENLGFRTSLNGDVGLTERMTITNAGNVGIGTTNPTSKLHVIDNTNTVQLTLTGTGAAGANIMLTGDGATTPNKYIRASGGGLQIVNSAYSLAAYSFSDDGDFTVNAPTDTDPSIVLSENGATKFSIWNDNTTDRLRVRDADSSAGVYLAQNGTSWTADSDIRLKENITKSEGILDKITQLNTYTFNMIGNDHTELGVVAQELLPIFPEVIDQNGEYYGVMYDRLGAIALGGIKEQYQLYQDQQIQLSSKLSLDTAGSLTIPNLQANTIETNTINVTQTNGLTIAGVSLEQLITNIVTQLIESGTLAINTISNQVDALTVQTQTLIADLTASTKVETNLISPLSDNDVTIQLGQTTATNSANLNVKNADNETVFSIDDQGNVSALGELIAGEINTATITAQTSLLGQITAGNIDTATLQAETASITGTLFAKSANVESARIAQLEAKMAEIEHVKATTAELVNATISGTLYADDIYGFEDKIAQALENSSLLNNLWPDSNQSTSSASVQSVYEVVDLAGFTATGAASLAQSIESLELSESDVVLTATATYIDKYFQVNGNGYIAGSLGVQKGIVVGDGMLIADSVIGQRPSINNPRPTLHIQPEGGSISLLAGLMTLDDSGRVSIKGNVDIAGQLAVQDSLLTNLLKPVDYNQPIQVQLAQVATVAGRPVTTNSRFEFINQDGMPVATVSAAGKASFRGGIDVGSQDLTATSSSQVESDQPSGKATIKAYTNDVIINSPLITDKSLIYVTPIGSTGNQVMYVKTQTADDPTTITTEGRFTVGFDYSLTQDASFNWWIVN